MRKYINEDASNGYKIIVVDDESGILDSLSIFLKRSGYQFTGVTNPLEAIELVKKEHFDLMLLDFIMTPIHGDQVVEEIRKFNKELYILLLTILVILLFCAMYFITQLFNLLLSFTKIVTSLFNSSFFCNLFIYFNVSGSNIFFISSPLK